jgi:L-threonylcarbamoyladenylate synthase
MTDQLHTIAVDPRYPDQAAVDEILRILDDGGIVVCPTETRYGLLARADREETVMKVYQAKDRNYDKPISMFIPHTGFVKYYAVATPLAQRLAALYLPGPLTLVLRVLEGARVPVARDGKVGLRISGSPLIAAITERTDYAVTATSANISGQPIPATIEEAREQLGQQVDLYVDGGRIEEPESTVVDCSEGCVVLREGGIPRAQVEAVARGAKA